ncbi:TPM domain-containing protein [Phenylobacterium sp.]|uniref:TPM domain-containing protein n=1 Tax=Phenylobacterium sp. TaxID=1871053 RepID=UPI0025E4BA08|nr:TPM domain-containing protein [Phenylobacterium sp.]
MALVRRLWLALALALVLPALALAAPKFPPLTGRVVDDANLLSPAAEARLTSELATLEQQTGHQLVVVTLPDLQGYEIEDYGYQLLRTWGIGRKGQDDGIILIVAPNQRKVRIEVGYGLEPVMTDALSSLIIQRAILPAFKAGDMEKGVVDGTEAIARQIGLPPDQQQAAIRDAEAQAQPAVAADGQGDSGSGIPIFIVVIVVFWILSGLMRAFGARRRFGGSGLWWLLPFILSGPGSSGRRGGGWSGGGGGWSSGGGGFSGGGGSGGGGGASGSW